MLSIAARWRDFDFSTIVQDHNFFWEDKEGTVGKAHGTLSRAERLNSLKLILSEGKVLKRPKGELASPAQ